MNYTVKPLQKQSEATEWEHAISAWKIKAKLHFVTTIIYFFSSQKSVSPYGFSADGPSVFQKWLGCNKLPNERFWAQLFPAETPFASCLAVTYAGICTHQSCFVSHPSLDGGGRNPLTGWSWIASTAWADTSFWGDLYSSLVAACL